MLRWNRQGLILIAAAFIAAVGCNVAAEREESSTSESNLSHVSYDGVIDLEGTALRSALNELVKNQHPLGYDRAKKVLFNDPAFRNANGKVECHYTGREVTPTGSTAVGGFNTEHTWPQSLGASHEPARSDLNHLFPVDARANSTRGNWPFGLVTSCAHHDPAAAADAGANVETDAGSDGETDATTTDSTSPLPAPPSDMRPCSFDVGGSAYGKDAFGASTFEVRAVKRGNVARAIFYFSVRYNLAVPPHEETALRAWHVADPVDAAEMARNDAVEAAQANRNPFIDHPEFVERITDF